MPVIASRPPAPCRHALLVGVGLICPHRSRFAPAILKKQAL